MPLEAGSSREVFSHNVAEMIKAGHPRAVALAAAYREAEDAEFNESDHPRDQEGKFANANFGTSKKKNVEEAIRAIKETGFHSQEWKKPGSSAAAIHSNGAIHVNSSHKYWVDPVGNQKAMFESRFLSSAHPSHILNHEIGHAIYDPPDNFFTLSHQDLAREKVSRYAAMNPKEFVSEVHAGMAGGREFPPEVMDLFKRYARKRTGDSAAHDCEMHGFDVEPECHIWEQFGNKTYCDDGKKKANDSIAFDRASVRNYDADGRMHVERTPISKANVCEYWGREIPGAEGLGLDLDRKYRLLRHPDELRKGADTFNNLPLLRRHVAVSADDHKPEDVIGATGTDAKFEHPYLTNSLVVWSGDDIAEIEKDLIKELSSAYRYRADMTPGDYEGDPYDGIMRDIVGNHVAKVKEGRAGPDVCVGDSKLEEPISITENITMTDKSVSPKRKAAADALTAYLVNHGIELKLASDEKFNAGLAEVFMAFDAEKDDDEDDKKKAEDDFPEKKPDCDAKDKKAKDMKAKDKKAMDDEMEAMDKKAKDEAEEKEKKEKEAADKKAKDEEMKDVKKAMDEAIAGERARQRDVRDAERFVRPWIGDLKVAFDSAEDVYKAALEARGKATKGIHPSAYRAILEMLPKPGNDRATAHNNRVAMDAAQTKSFAEMYPGAMDIKLSA